MQYNIMLDLFFYVADERVTEARGQDDISDDNFFYIADERMPEARVQYDIIYDIFFLIFNDNSSIPYVWKMTHKAWNKMIHAMIGNGGGKGGAGVVENQEDE